MGGWPPEVAFRIIRFLQVEETYAAPLLLQPNKRPEKQMFLLGSYIKYSWHLTKHIFRVPLLVPFVIIEIDPELGQGLGES